MALALVASTFVIGVGGNGATSPAINTAGANLAIVYVGYYTSTVTVTDSKGNVWNALTNNVAAGCAGQLWYSSLASVGAGHTFTVAGTGTYSSIAVQIWSGAHAIPFDKQAVMGNSGLNVQLPSTTPAVNNSLIITGITMQANEVPAIDLGFTLTPGALFTNGQGLGAYSAYLLQGTAAAVAPNWTYTIGNQVVASIAVFKPGAIPVIPTGYPTVLCAGLAYTLIQNMVYVLPAKTVRLFSTVELEVSVNGTTWSTLTGSTTGIKTSAAFVRCPTANAVVSVGAR